MLIHSIRMRGTCFNKALLRAGKNPNKIEDGIGIDSKDPFLRNAKEPLKSVNSPDFL